MSDRLDPHDAAVRRGAGDRDRPALRPVPGAAQHAARSRRRRSRAGRPAVRRARRLAVPHRAGDGADRALDDAADPRPGCSPGASINISRVDLGIETEQLVTFGALARAQRLHARAIEGALRAGRGRARRAARRHRRRRRRSCRCWPATTGATASSVQGFDAGPGHRHQLAVQRGQPGLLRHGRHAAARRPRVHARRHRWRGPKVAIVNEAFARKFNLTGHVVGKRMASESGNGAKLDIEIVGLVKDAKYSEVKREIPPVFFTPYRQDERGRLDHLLRADAARRRGSCCQAIPRLVARLDPNLPVEDCRTMDAAGARRTSSSTA